MRATSVLPAVTIADKRPNSANAVMDKVPTSTSSDATGTIPLNNNPLKPAMSVNNPPPHYNMEY